MPLESLRRESLRRYTEDPVNAVIEDRMYETAYQRFKANQDVFMERMDALLMADEWRRHLRQRVLWAYR